MWLLILLGVPLIGQLILWLGPPSVGRYAATAVTGLNLFAGSYFVLNFKQTSLLSGFFMPLDTLSRVVFGMTLLVGFTASVYSVGYVRRGHLPHGQSTVHAERKYFSLLLAFYWALLAVPLVENIVLTWALIEATALASVFLVDFNRTKKTAEASWKYLILMDVGGVSALLGTVAILIGEPSISQLASWTGLTHIASTIPTKWLWISFVLILVGYGTKAGLVPWNAWLPDAHSQAPSPISAMLSAIKLNVAMYGIIRFQGILRAGHQSSFADHALIAVGLLTVFVSTLMTIAQHDVKRLFAYSSSENLGLIAIGFSLGPIGTLGAYLQMVNHSVIKSMLFYQSGELLLQTDTTEIRRFHGMIRQMPIVGTTLLLGMLAIAGAPPFGLFISEFTIIFALVHEASPWLAAFVTLLLAVLFANFLYYAMQIGLGKPTRRGLQIDSNKARWTTWFPLLTHTLSSLALGLFLPYLLLVAHWIRL